MNFGVDGFYSGKTANLIVAEMQKGNGVMTLEDLANYKTVTRNESAFIGRGSHRANAKYIERL